MAGSTDQREGWTSRRRSTMLACLGATVLGALVLAPGAFASTLAYSNGTLTYTAAGSQAVDVTFGEPAAGTVEVRIYDTDPVTGAVPANCTSTPPTTGAPSSDYTCTGVTLLTGNGGPLADSLSAQGDSRSTPADPAIADIPTTLNGGDGNDNLTAGTAGATLNGGNGDDTLSGGPGNDVLNGDASDDTLYGDETTSFQQPSGAPTSNADVLSGGDGNDTLYPSNGPNQVSGGAGVGQRPPRRTFGGDRRHGVDRRPAVARCLPPLPPAAASRRRGPAASGW